MPKLTKEQLKQIEDYIVVSSAKLFHNLYIVISSFYIVTLCYHDVANKKRKRNYTYTI